MTSVTISWGSGGQINAFVIIGDDTLQTRVGGHKIAKTC